MLSKQILPDYMTFGDKKLRSVISHNMFMKSCFPKKSRKVEKRVIEFLVKTFLKTVGRSIDDLLCS